MGSVPAAVGIEPGRQQSHAPVESENSAPWRSASISSAVFCESAIAGGGSEANGTPSILRRGAGGIPGDPKTTSAKEPWP
jgi:hypothetical protein